MSTKKMMRELRREMPAGSKVFLSGRHVRIVLPNGRFVTTGASPSCCRFMQNTRRYVRKEMQR
jgi:hypothetical protein